MTPDHSKPTADDLVVRVLHFVSSHLCIRVTDLHEQLTLRGDLHMEGLDAEEFFVDFGRVFEVDLTDFHIGRHFGGEGCNPFAVVLPIVWLITRGRRGVLNEKLLPVTIGDLVASARKHVWSPVRRCARCGYDLRASATTCPECGSTNLT